jgi:hypothetical protein
VVISAQEPVENQLISFLNQVAEMNRNLYFAYIPRREKDYTQCFKSTNIGVFYGNIYEFIKAGDIHTTVYSTTCLEANYLEKINIFININNYSRFYYEDVFQSGSGAYFAETPAEFVSLILEHQKEKAPVDTRFYAENHEEKIQKLIQRYLEI